MSKKILVLPRFLELADSLQKEQKGKLFKALKLLSSDSKHPSLQTKKVRASKADVFECRVDLGTRLIYANSPDSLKCLYVGGHDDALHFAERLTNSDSIMVDDIVLGESEGIEIDESSQVVNDEGSILLDETAYIELDIDTKKDWEA